MLQRSNKLHSRGQEKMPEHITSCWDRGSQWQTRCAPLPLWFSGWCFPEMEVDCWRFITH